MSFNDAAPILGISTINAISWVFCAIIYQLATSGLASTARTASIYKAEKFADHAPLTIGYDFNL